MLSKHQAFYIFVLLKCALARSPVRCTIPVDQDVDKILGVIVQKKCTIVTFGDLTVPAGKKLDLRVLPQGIELVFTGTIVFKCNPQNRHALEYFVYIEGKNLHITGATGNKFDGSGACYWDKNNNDGKLNPKFFLFHLVDSHVEGLSVLNAPAHVFMISNSQNTIFNNINIDNQAGDGLAKNTDGFHVTQSTGIIIRDCYVHNQDDCFTATSGSNITFTKSQCLGGNGASIGSIGQKRSNDVSDVTISYITITDSLNGFRIKTIQGASGSVINIKVTDIVINNIKDFGILIRQDYLDAKGNVPQRAATNGVKIRGLKISNFKGTVREKAQRVLVYCGDGSCSDWQWSNIQITGGTAEGLAKCQNIPKDPKNGVKCQ
ncbi:unnamed protein product [Albugo candida]|uniref:endo-polygalacturonase n=1 Tax=Albugo candida TaxID=65357 RepID=A0A024G557_9STRA|nr:unnamed protein product [Albugo candida]|eukprot:CCI41871.1 unnamed protein product [Albugo candida]